MAIDYTGRPPIPTFTNVATGEILELQFHPLQLTEEISGDYSSAKVIGYSSRPLQYGGTGNPSHKGMLFPFDARFDGGSYERVADARLFFLSLFYPLRGTTVSSGGTPEVQFTVPKVASYTGKATNYKCAWEFGADGRLIAIGVTLDFEGDPPSKLYSDEVRAKGFWF